MTFLNPLGLLGLIGIPVLILIYILKNKFIEQVIPSTYIWTLSEKFLKKRNPLNKITGIISLILQLLLVLILSFTLAHPVLVVDGGAKEYTFILDGSGSMSITEEGRTRFDIGKDEIKGIIEESVNGSSYSLIISDEATRVVFEDVYDRELAISILDEIIPKHTASDTVDAIGIAQEYFNASGGAALTYLVTDRSYQSAENIRVIDVSGASQNYTLTDTRFDYDGKTVTVYGKVISHTEDASVNILAFTDEVKTPVSTTALSLVKGEYSDFEMRFDSQYFYSVRLSVSEADSL
jgi:hypothetical protein